LGYNVRESFYFKKCKKSFIFLPMMNRRPSSKIFLTAAFSIALTPVLISHAEPGVPSANLATDATPVVPTPATPAPVEPPVATPAPAAPDTAPTTPAERPTSYTVVSGDSLWLIAHKFKSSVKSLKALNKLTTNNLKPGQVLQIPPAGGTSRESKPTPPPAAKPSASATTRHKTFAKAQPAQDFDLTAKLAPAQLDSSSEIVTKSPDHSTVTPKIVSYPVAKPVSVAELAAASATLRKSAPAAQVSHDEVPSLSKTAFASPSSKQPAHGSDSSANPLVTTPENDWKNRFVQEARTLANRGIEYDEDWRPPGESQAWAMDCSNTTRYLYKVTTGIQLPRTASDQYYYLHQQDKAWDVPMSSNGFADVHFLSQNLKPGDLLFWENTYKPERQPPITHVMVFLGTNDKGQWIMAGSQTSRGGEHNRSNGGPDIYAFNPTKPCGGYSTWLGLVHHQGRFCAYGRPLEADASKLAVASND
jgi:LysM repeat protein